MPAALKEFLEENPDVEEKYVIALKSARFIGIKLTKQTYIEILDTLKRTTN